jgi:hypothetical protein
MADKQPNGTKRAYPDEGIKDVAPGDIETHGLTPEEDKRILRRIDL